MSTASPIQDYIVRNAGVRDESNLVIEETSNISPFVAVVPLFAPEGKEHEFLHFTGSGRYVGHFGGNEFLNVETYGQSGLNGQQVLVGGGEILAYRLTAKNAKCASAMLAVAVTADPAIVQYQRDSTGAFILNASKQRVPIDDPDDVGHPLTAAGVKIKLLVTEVADFKSTSLGIPVVAGSTTTYPIMMFKHYGAGAKGQKYGFSMTNDVRRDKAVADGRRYKLSLVKKTEDGNTSELNEAISVSFNIKSETFPGSKVPEYILNKYPKLVDNFENPLGMTLYQASINELLKKLSANVSSGSAFDIDFLFGLDAKGVEYDRIIVDPTSVDIKNAIAFLLGGHEGSLQLGATVPNPAGAGTVVVDAAMVTANKEQLLKDFFTCDLNPDILDPRMVPAIHVFDAAYPLTVKEKMLTDFREFCPTIHVWVDCLFNESGDDAINMQKAYETMIDSERGFGVTCVGFDGMTLENIPQKVTGTYELARAIPETYRSIGTFVPYAGYDAGALKYMTVSWYGRPSKDDQLGRLEESGIVYLRKLNHAGHMAIMNERTQYNLDYSKLKSTRNANICEDAQIIGYLELPKYVWDPKGAASSIERATTALLGIYSKRYPENVKVSFNIYRTKEDIATDNAHMDIIVEFPDVLQSFTTTIVARRAAPAA